MTANTSTSRIDSLSSITYEALLLVESLGLHLDDKLTKRLTTPTVNEWQETIKQIPAVLKCNSQSCNWK